jgi:hypothetical protein
MVAKTPSNVLSAIKSAFQIKDHYPRLRQALLAGMQHHFNLPDDLVLLALVDDDIELELKSKSLDKLLDSEVPACSKKGNLTFLLFRCQES